jgi:hypothetical protein
MPDHPYRRLPDHCFWDRSVAGIPGEEVDPVLGAKFTIAPADRIMTAGSCFAQQIAGRLGSLGLTPYVTEDAHPILPDRLARAYGYGLYTARYGNIYTARQLLQLLRRAYGRFQPEEDAWTAPSGTVIDPFRPRVQPGGFPTMAEFRADRARHFAAVRRAVETAEILVYTLGLTETWVADADGAVFPLCPGVAGGEFDPAKHRFVNPGVAEVTEDLRQAIRFMRERNPAIGVVLTVSPVPLVATAEDRSVLVSTTLSKAVLRLAAESVAGGDDRIAYFPAYEIVAGPHARGRYLADDLRSVTPGGVDHVMHLFFRHYGPRDAGPAAEPSAAALYAERMEAAARAICDEELLGTR